MSSLIIEVCRVDAVELHPNADRMAVARVKGWRTCINRYPDTGTLQFEVGDRCVYVPPDSVLPQALSDRLGVTKYLSALPPNADGVRPPGGRVRVARLRGEPSYGLILKPDDPAWEVGRDVAGHYGITKWEPPLQSSDGEAERSPAAFHRYSEIENYRNFPGLFQDGEEVVMTEKIHGTNCRAGLIRSQDETGNFVWTWMAGSHNQRRKEFMTLDKKVPDPELGEKTITVTRRSRYWEALTEPVKALMADVSAGANDVVVFGEIFGSGVQDMAYGLENGRFAFRVFDVAVNGKYLEFDVKAELCAKHAVEMVPLLYRGPFAPEKVEAHASGPTTLCPPERAGKFKGREGIVIVPVRERAVTTEAHVFDRLILKCVSFDYLERKGGTEWH